jgi:hypothetical protein
MMLGFGLQCSQRERGEGRYDRHFSSHSQKVNQPISLLYEHAMSRKKGEGAREWVCAGRGWSSAGHIYLPVNASGAR